MQLVRRRLGDTIDRDAVNSLLNDLSVDLVTRINRMEERLNDSIGEVIMDVGDMRAAVRGHTSEIEEIRDEMSSDAEDLGQRLAVLEASEQQKADVTRGQFEALETGVAAAEAVTAKLEKERLHRDDEYWSRCLYLRGFNADPAIPHTGRYDHVHSKLVRPVKVGFHH